MVRKRILICEDDALLAHDIAAQVVAAGHIAIGPAATADAALDFAEMDELDAAIIDLNLSDGRSGLAIAREMSGRGVPIILCSGDTPAPHELKETRHIYIAKPVDEAMLLSCIKSIFAGAVEAEPIAVPRGVTTTEASAATSAI